ncbi:hypothetical protein BDZ45DRAFT_811217 [Acephala macrosclerotiorum]|nr:hypothetical protein BDZ45DRAFT_811217 [Acephala macrosclerotiorum]
MANVRRPHDDEIPRDDQPSWYFDIDRAAEAALRKPIDLPDRKKTEAEARELMKIHEELYRHEVAQNLLLYPQQYYLAEFLAIYTVWRAAFDRGRGDVLEHAETPPERLNTVQITELLTTGKITFRTIGGKEYTVNPVMDMPVEQGLIATPTASTLSISGPVAQPEFDHQPQLQHSQLTTPASLMNPTQLTWKPNQTPSTLERLPASLSSSPTLPESYLKSMALPLQPGANVPLFSGHSHASSLPGSDAPTTTKKRKRGHPANDSLSASSPALPSMLDRPQPQSFTSPGTFGAPFGDGNLPPLMPYMGFPPSLVPPQSSTMPGTMAATPLGHGQVAIPQSTPRSGSRRMGACSECRKSKQACSGGVPRCERCTKKHLTCAYLAPGMVLTPYIPALHQGLPVYTNMTTLPTQHMIQQPQSLPPYAPVVQRPFVPTQAYSLADEVYGQPALKSPEVKTEEDKGQLK